MSKSLTTIKPSSFEENVRAYREIPESEWMDLPLPGDILREEFMEPYGVSAYKLAKSMGVSQSHICDILKGKRNITMEMSFRLGLAFNMSPSFFHNLQVAHDEILLVRRYAISPLNIPCLVPVAA